MKSRLERGICLWLVIMIGSLLIVKQPLLATVNEKQMVTQEDVMGSAAKLIVDEDECWVHHIGMRYPYTITLKDVPGTLFSEQGEMRIYIVAALDERGSAAGITFDDSKVELVAKQNDNELQARCKLEKDGKLLIKVSEIDRNEGVSITLQDLQLVFDRTVPDGHYYLEAISADEKNYLKKVCLLKHLGVVESLL